MGQSRKRTLSLGIREHLGFTKPTVVDGEHLIVWLMTHILSQAPTLLQCLDKARQFLRSNRLEPFAPKELERLIRSALSRYEKQFFKEIFNSLSLETKKSIDDLLEIDVAEKRKDQAHTNMEFKLLYLKKDMANAQYPVSNSHGWIGRIIDPADPQNANVC